MFLLKKSPEKKGFLSRLSQGVANLILGKKTIDADVLESLETALLTADIGIESTNTLIQKLTDRVSRKELQDPAKLMEALKEEMIKCLQPYQQSITIHQKPFVILMVGINGAGKTTSIAKLAHHYKKQGKSVMLAAGDTFRAAAIDQLKVWGDRNNIGVIAQLPGADSASVIYDAMQSASAKNIDILIADTSCPLHTHNHLIH